MFLSVNEMLTATERSLDLHVLGNHVLAKRAEVTGRSTVMRVRCLLAAVGIDRPI